MTLPIKPQKARRIHLANEGIGKSVTKPHSIDVSSRGDTVWVTAHDG